MKIIVKFVDLKDKDTYAVYYANKSLLLLNTSYSGNCRIIHLKSA